jgi:hypothetical protein
VDWSQWLKDGDTIASSTWTVTGGITKGVEVITADKRRTSVMLGGGTTPTEYQVTNSITTTQGRVDRRSFFVKMVDE